MKVSLMDLDVIKQRRLFPNLALMKLSTYHKARGDEVYLNFPLQQPDISYASCVFTWNAVRRASVPEAATLGGSGIDLKAVLPPEVEHIMPDYSLYPNVDFSLGFTSRGCIRRCPWCIVPVKEGQIRAWGRIYEFWNRSHRKLMLLDNNLLAAPNWRTTLEDLIEEDIEVDINQGMDIRLVNEENVALLKLVKSKQLRFGFDSISLESEFRKGMDCLKDAGISMSKLMIYILVGFDSTPDEDFARLEIIKEYKADAFIMVYQEVNGVKPKIKEWLPTKRVLPNVRIPRGNLNKYLREFARWNNLFYFRGLPFEDYLKARHLNIRNSEVER